MSQGNRLGMMQPQVIVLKEGTDSSQGVPQLLSNIGACASIVSCVASTLGPRGMDKLIVNSRGQATISNDGATILKLLEIVHPAARTLVDIARAQDAEVGDGTTSVVLLAGEMLKESKSFIEEGVNPQTIIKGYRKAAQLVSRRDLAVCYEKERLEALRFKWKEWKDREHLGTSGRNCLSQALDLCRRSRLIDFGFDLSRMIL